MSLLSTNANFRRLFSATAITNLGDGVSVLAFPWLASLITRDPALIALVAAATRLPWVLLSIPSGVLTDRADRKRLIVQADMLRLGLTVAVVALILGIGSLPPPGDPLPYILGLSALAFLLGSAEVLRDNAAQTILPNLVNKDDLEKANGQLWSVEHIMGSFVGPPLAGFLIAWSVPAPFLLDAATFGLAAWIVWTIAMPPAELRLAASPIAAAIEGGRWIWNAPIIFRLAILLGLLNAFSTMTLTMMVLFAQDVLGLSAAGYGILLTFGAAGGVIGGLACPKLAKRIGTRNSLLLALVLLMTTMLAIAVTGSVVITALAVFFEMLGALLWNVVTVSYRQRVIPDELLGRVNSIYRFFGWGLTPVGAIAGGLIVGWAEPDMGRDLALRLPFYIGAGGVGLLFIYSLFRLRL